MLRLPFIEPRVLLCAGLLLAPALHADDSAAPAPQRASPFPLQLEAVVPYEPSVFASDGKQLLVYELALRSFERVPLQLQELTISDFSDSAAAPLVTFDAERLRAMTRVAGVRPPEAGTVAELPGSGHATIYVLLEFDAGFAVPAQLRHELGTSSGKIVTEGISTQHDEVRVLAAPVKGSGWLAETGLSNDNGHRRGNVVIDGRSVTSRRYAFDWVQVEKGVMFAGDEKDNTSWFGYGEELVAVADAVVAGVTDGVAQNRPGGMDVADTFANVPGNRVTLDLGNGHYAHYMHVQPGSIRVKPGDTVRRGQVLALLGNSGNSFAPHLHFEVTNSATVLAGEGVPYVIDRFRAADTAVEHAAELPAEKTLADFSN